MKKKLWNEKLNQLENTLLIRKSKPKKFQDVKIMINIRKQRKAMSLINLKKLYSLRNLKLFNTKFERLNKKLK